MFCSIFAKMRFLGFSLEAFLISIFASCAKYLGSVICIVFPCVDCCRVLCLLLFCFVLLGSRAIAVIVHFGVQGFFVHLGKFRSGKKNKDGQATFQTDAIYNTQMQANAYQGRRRIHNFVRSCNVSVYRSLSAV